MGVGLSSLTCKKEHCNNVTTLSQNQLQNRTVAIRAGFFNKTINFFGLKRSNLLAVHTVYFHAPLSWEIVFDFFVVMLLNELKYDLLEVGRGGGGVEISGCCLLFYTGKCKSKFANISL
jgi:hypothetical protein